MRSLLIWSLSWGTVASLSVRWSQVAFDRAALGVGAATVSEKWFGSSKTAPESPTWLHLRDVS